MQITCPHCDFSKSVEPSQLPDRSVKVTCPRCKQGFSFDKTSILAAARDAQPPQPAPPAAAPPEPVSCPACGLAQEAAASCRACGVNFAKLQARQAEAGTANGAASVENAAVAELRHSAVDQAAAYQPKAGFWIRVVAYLLDSFLLGIVQFILSLVITLTVGLLGIAVDGDPAVNIVIWLFGVTISIGYAVFFTGYCGQTPGKMALRIKVIRTDGSAVTYGRAALREVLGKFVSGILLGIGYIMVAFDSQKQGLHDKIADTYVVKL